MTNTDEKPKAKRPRRMARESIWASERQSAPKRENKTELVLALLGRDEGATIEQLSSATGWLPHTARAALTGLKKKGHTVTSEKVEGQGRAYRVATR